MTEESATPRAAPSFSRPLLSMYDLTKDQLAQQLEQWKEPAFRTTQIWTWLYSRYVSQFDEMTDLSKSLRAKLQSTYVLNRFESVSETSSTDGWTHKWLLRSGDGAEVEAVLMEYEGIRRTACISSQAGCAMNCSFCATGQMGFVRNLRAGEIIEQVIWVARALSTHAPPDKRWVSLDNRSTRLSNIVYMGMGEPFANYSHVIESVDRLTESQDEGGFGLGARKITISTVGIVPGINRFAAEGSQTNLAVSLHAATDELRSQLVPINQRYPLYQVALAIREYINKTNRRVSLEWALIDGVNDTIDQAKALVALIRSTFDPLIERRHMLHVNMIPLNPTGAFRGHASQRENIQAFCEVLDHESIPNTVRMRRGIDISAGCGQLKAQAHKLRS